MAQRNQHGCSGPGDTAWLAMLVDTFVAAERLGDVPCESEAVSAVRERLARPATALAAGGSRPESAFDLQH
jgi:hypothetical protein